MPNNTDYGKCMFASSDPAELDQLIRFASHIHSKYFSIQKGGSVDNDKMKLICDLLDSIQTLLKWMVVAKIYVAKGEEADEEEGKEEGTEGKENTDETEVKVEEEGTDGKEEETEGEET